MIRVLPTFSPLDPPLRWQFYKNILNMCLNLPEHLCFPSYIILVRHITDNYIFSPQRLQTHAY